jgi:hypothetical protein
MKRVGMYLWDHLRGRHHIGRSLVNAVVANTATQAIYLVGARLFFQPFDLKAGILPTSPQDMREFATQVFGIFGNRAALVWGLVGVAWSAVRTINGKNEAGPIAKFLSYSIMLLLAAAFVFVVSSDVRRVTTLG